MKRGLSWSMRFALTVSVVFAVGTLIAGMVAWMLQSEELAKRLQADVAAIATSLAVSAETGDRQDLVEQVTAHAATAQGNALLVAFVDGTTGESVGNMVLTAPFSGYRRLVPGADFSFVRPQQDQQPEGYYAFGVHTRLGWIVAAKDDAWNVEGREVLLASTAWGLGLALVLTVAFAVFIARRNEARIARMERVLEAVGAGRTELRIRERGRDDIARLAARVDATLDRLEDGIAAIRQVSTDVAHDLRAPLARLRIRLEPQALDPANSEALRREIGAAIADLDSVSATFDAILRLSRLQSGAIELERKQVDLGALAADIHELLAPTAEDMGQDPVFERPDAAVFAIGDRELLAQAVVNLVDNALRHCPAPARIVLAVAAEGGGPVISVCDDGPGIAGVLDRFVRLDAARATPGTSLGLALLATIAELRGARLVLEDNAPGLCARIIFAAGETAERPIFGPPS